MRIKYRSNVTQFNLGHVDYLRLGHCRSAGPPKPALPSIKARSLPNNTQHQKSPGIHVHGLHAFARSTNHHNSNSTTPSDAAKGLFSILCDISLLSGTALFSWFDETCDNVWDSFSGVFFIVS